MNMNKIKIRYNFIFALLFFATPVFVLGKTVNGNCNCILRKAASFPVFEIAMACKNVDYDGRPSSYIPCSDDDDNEGNKKALKDLEAKCPGGSLSEIVYKCYKDDPVNYKRAELSPFLACFLYFDSVGLTHKVYNVKYSAECTGSTLVDNDTNNNTDSSGTIDEHFGDDFCEDMSNTFAIFGYILLFLKILVPFIIIILGSFDLYKAVISSDDDAIKKQSVKLGRRVIGGVIIFFIPQLINGTLSLLNSWNLYKGDYESCAKCVLSPTKCELGVKIPKGDPAPTSPAPTTPTTTTPTEKYITTKISGSCDCKITFTDRNTKNGRIECQYVDINNKSNACSLKVQDTYTKLCPKGEIKD